MIFTGRGLFSDMPGTIAFHPAEPGMGVIFRRSDLDGAEIRAHPDNIVPDLPNCTALEAGNERVLVVEHVLACLAGLQIDNIVIEVDGEELPGLDGCAGDYLDTLKRAGRAEQDAQVRIRKLRVPIIIGNLEKSLILFPSDEFSISYLLDHADPALGTQFVHNVTKDRFVDDLLPARTFITEDEARQAIEAGFLKHEKRDRAILIGGDGPSKEFLSDNEPACHKAQDIVGDLAIFSHHLIARIIGIKSGHHLNHIAVKRLQMLLP